MIVETFLFVVIPCGDNTRTNYHDHAHERYAVTVTSVPYGRYG